MGSCFGLLHGTPTHQTRMIVNFGSEIGKQIRYIRHPQDFLRMQTKHFVTFRTSMCLGAQKKFLTPVHIYFCFCLPKMKIRPENLGFTRYSPYSLFHFWTFFCLNIPEYSGIFGNMVPVLDHVCWNIPLFQNYTV